MAKIVVIAKVTHHIEEMQKVLTSLSLDIPLLYAPDSERCFELAAAEIDKGAKIIVCSDFLYAKYFESLDAKIIPIYRSPYLFAKCIIQTLEADPCARIVCRSDAHSFTSSILDAVSLLDSKPQVSFANNEDELRPVLRGFASEGRAKMVIAPVWAHATIREYGFTPVNLPFAQDDFRRSLDRALGELARMEEQEKFGELFSTILDLVTAGIICLDSDGTVTGINRIAADTLGIRGNIVGKKCSGIGLDRIYDTAKGADTNEAVETIMELMGVSLKVNILPQLAGDRVNAYVATLSAVDDILSDERKIRRSLNSGGNSAHLRYTDIIGTSPAIVKAKHLAKRFSAADSTILIHGPTGSGKEVFAQSIHNLSSRRDQPFVVINCAALPESLLESVLFGYDKGSFTGAQRDGKRGLFEAAHKGTIFLDEIGEMPLSMQARFLRVIQEREVMRIGSTKPIPIDVRIIAATNRDLRAMVAEKRFREDLYYRISVLVLELPALSERKEDIPLLARWFLSSRGAELGAPDIKISSEAMEFISNLQLDGNIRELNNILERCIILSDRKCITLDTLLLSLEQAQASSVPSPACGSGSSELSELLSALSRANGERKRAAEILGISTSTLWRKMKKYNLFKAAD